MRWWCQYPPVVETVGVAGVHDDVVPLLGKISGGVQAETGGRSGDENANHGTTLTQKDQCGTR